MTSNTFDRKQIFEEMANMIELIKHAENYIQIKPMDSSTKEAFMKRISELERELEVLCQKI
jgi:hypothetical protein